MCTRNCIYFGAVSITKDEVEHKKIIEVGSIDINGSLRPIYEYWNPAQYVGIDIEYGPGVDIVCDAEDILERFGENSFDIVVSTELLEHVKNWRKVISNMKNICKPDGIILITTRSQGYLYHGYPYDFWRYEIQDMKHIFSDCKIVKIENDKEPGVLLKIIKPANFIENDLSNYKLFSFIENKRVLDIDDKTHNDFLREYHRRQDLNNKVQNIVIKSVNIILKCLVIIKKFVNMLKAVASGVSKRFKRLLL